MKSVARARRLFSLFMARQEKQFVDLVMYEHYLKLDSDAKVEFIEEQHPDFDPYDVWRRKY